MNIQKIISEIRSNCNESTAINNISKIKELSEYGFLIKFHKPPYIILQKRNCEEVIIWNYLLLYKGIDKHHTHLESFNIAKKIVENICNQKYPKSKTRWILKSYARISDSNYIHRDKIFSALGLETRAV